jgi:cell division cycle 20-like protein 1 (cofactor of APC complex)
MFPTSQPNTRTHSPAHRLQSSPSRHAHLRKPMSFHTTNIPIPTSHAPVSSAGHTPLHHYPPPDMATSAARGREDRDYSPAASLPPLPMHAPTTPISGHGRAPGAGPSGSHYRAHQSQVALTSGQNRRTTPPNSGGRKSAFSPPPSDGVPSPGTPSKKRILNFTSPSAVRMSPFANGLNGATGVGDLDDMRHERYNTSPLGNESHRVLQSPRKGIRQIARTPFKVLDAPELAVSCLLLHCTKAKLTIQDDFYLNLVSWSSSNVLAVGLNNCVYLWSAASSKVDKLCENEATGGEITGLEWTNKVSHAHLRVE